MYAQLVPIIDCVAFAEAEAATTHTRSLHLHVTLAPAETTHSSHHKIIRNRWPSFYPVAALRKQTRYSAEPRPRPAPHPPSRQAARRRN